MRVLVALDCHGTARSGGGRAAAIATGWTRLATGRLFIVAPQSSMVVLLLRCCWPRDPPAACLWATEHRRERGVGVRSASATAYLSAQACGLGLLGGRPRPRPRWRPIKGRASAVLIAAALRAGAALRIVVGLKAYTDGKDDYAWRWPGRGPPITLADVEVIAAWMPKCPLL